MNAPRPERANNSVFEIQNLLMQGLVSALELGVEQERRAQTMEEMAMLDPLTGLHNRRALAKTFAALQHVDGKRQNDLTRNGSPVSLIALDVDHFKQVNDTFGHVEGDAILQSVAGVIRGSTRERDMPARIGGEEFAILLPRVDQDDAIKIAEKIRQRIETEGRVTVSAGVVAVDMHNTLESNLEWADQALYYSKEHGRNQTTAYSHIAEPKAH